MDWPLAVTIVGVVWGVVAFFAVIAWSATKQGRRSSARVEPKETRWTSE